MLHLVGAGSLRGLLQKHFFFYLELAPSTGMGAHQPASMISLVRIHVYPGRWIKVWKGFGSQWHCGTDTVLFQALLTIYPLLSQQKSHKYVSVRTRFIFLVVVGEKCVCVFVCANAHVHHKGTNTKFLLDSPNQTPRPQWVMCRTLHFSIKKMLV